MTTSTVLLTLLQLHCVSCEVRPASYPRMGEIGALTVAPRDVVDQTMALPGTVSPSYRPDASILRT